MLGCWPKVMSYLASPKSPSLRQPLLSTNKLFGFRSLLKSLGSILEYNFIAPVKNPMLVKVFQAKEGLKSVRFYICRGENQTLVFDDHLATRNENSIWMFLKSPPNLYP